MSTSDKDRGIFMGVACGDAMGAPCEFGHPRRARAFNGEITDGWAVRSNSKYGTWRTYATGQVTDDTEMTVACLRTLQGGYSVEAAVRSYNDFAQSGTRSLGANTRKLFHGYKRQATFWSRFDRRFPTLEAVEAAQSNGHLMRAAPFALLEDAVTRRRAARLDTMLTNPSSVSLRCSEVFVELLHTLRHEEDPDRARAAVRERTALEATLGDMDQCFAHALDPLFPRDLETERGRVLHALSAALWAGIHAPSMQEGLVSVVRKAGDTDTNASIAGAVLGAVWGEKRSLENDTLRRNYQRILACRPFIRSGTKRKQESTEEPRPACYHPAHLAPLAGAVLSAPQPNARIAAQHDELEKRLLVKRRRRARGLVVALAGASRAGKSTLAKAVQSRMAKANQEVYSTVLAQDAFRMRGSVQSENGKRSWEHEMLTDWPKLVESIKSEKTRCDVVIVEGYLLVANEQLTELVDRWVHVASTCEQCCQRRGAYPKEEDLGEQGWTSASSYVLGAVWPKHMEFVDRIPSGALWLEPSGDVAQRTEATVQYVHSALGQLAQPSPRDQDLPQPPLVLHDGSESDDE